MTDVVLEREYEQAMTLDDFTAMATEGGGFELHQVMWQESFLSEDGKTLICRFIAPDAESARIALRQGGIEYKDLWPATVHDVPNDKNMNVIVERSFDDGVELDDIQAIEDAGAHCLDLHHVSFVRTLFSLDRKRMICIYHAPDAESVRMAQRQAKMPLERVWACQRITPETLNKPA